VTVDLTASLAAVLAAGTPSPTPVRTIDPARVTPGLLGLGALLFLVIAGYFLARSMIKQFKKIDFDEEATELGIARPEKRPTEEPATTEAAEAADAVEETPNSAQA
jgi:hypothetical protein